MEARWTTGPAAEGEPVDEEEALARILNEEEEEQPTPEAERRAR